jgi:hypothetical protein
MKKLYDQENLITLAMMWQHEHGDAMMPNTAHLTSYFPSPGSEKADGIGLHIHDSFPSIKYVSKALLPFLVGLSLGKDSVYLAAFDAQQLNYQDFRPFRSAQADLLKYFSSRHELSQNWIDTFEDKDREIMAMAGIGDKQKLSLPALGRVFSSELGL